MDSSGSILRFSHLSYQVKTKGGVAKVLVDDVSVEIKAGELLAIMVRFMAYFSSVSYIQ
jgi:ABC-type glutathione transport system ATPase component